MWGNEGRYRRITDRDIRESIAYEISLRNRMLNVMALVYEKIDVLPEKPWKHTCVGVGIIETLPNTIIVGNEVPVRYIYCNQCNKIIYYVEQVY